MGTQATAGTTLAISTSLPETFDAVASTGYPSETYVTLGKVENFPEIGQESSESSSSPVGEIDKIFGFGSRQGVLQNWLITYDDADNGQSAAEDNLRSEVACEVTYPDGAIDYFTLNLLSFKRAPGGADSNVMANFTGRQTRATVRVDAS